MAVGGISGGAGHIGAAQSTRQANTLKNIGAAAFDTMVNVGTVAAGAFAGPAGASAVSSLRGMSGAFGSSGDVGGNLDSQVSNIQSQADASTNQALSQSGQEAQADFSRQLGLFRLQRSVNMQSQTNNMIANMQKARHDAMMATIQNVR